MKRRRYAIVTGLVAPAFAAAFAAIAVADPLPRFIWNASASAPIGLYRIQTDSNPAAGELVAITPPKPLAGWLSARGYLPEGLPLLKHVAAKARQRVCRTGNVVSVDTRPVAVALSRDSRGRPLPVWQGCRIIEPGELLLLNPSIPDSLDGRYFGPLPRSALLGRAIPILTRDTPQSSLIWRGIGS